MKVTILGSGTCASQLPEIPNRFPPAFLVEWADQKVLFDCSEGVRFRLEQAGYDYASIQHIAISHPHPDHNALVHFIQSSFCKGIWEGERPRADRELHVYCPDQLAADFPSLWKIYIPEQGYFASLKPILHPMSSRENVHAIGQGRLSAFSVYHGFGRVDAVAFRLETPEGAFAYSGDTGDCPGVRSAAGGADIFVCECSARIGNVKSTKEYGHLTPYAAGQIAQEARVKKLVFFHYTGRDSDEAIVKDCQQSGFVGEIIVGKDFQVLEITS